MRGLNVILITIKSDLQSYSWWKDIISQIDCESNKNKEIQQKQNTPTIDLQTVNKQDITANGIILASESFILEYKKVIRSDSNGSKSIQQIWQFWQWHPARQQIEHCHKWYNSCFTVFHSGIQESDQEWQQWVKEHPTNMAVLTMTPSSS